MKVAELKRKPCTGICEHCGNEFTTDYPSRVAQRRFCSRTCFFASGVAQTETAREKRRRANSDRSGANNPNFKHGRRTGLQIRGFTLKLKGEDCCRNCGGVGPTEMHRLHLHHAIPRSLCRETRDKLLNGIPLCPKCHKGWHARSLVLYRDIFTAEEWAYISSVKLTGQRIEAWLDDRYPERPMTCGAAVPIVSRSGDGRDFDTRSPREDAA